MKILICDDEKVYVDTISTNIYYYFDNKQIPYSVSTFTDSSEIFRNNEKYDIAFLDIEMKPKNGIEIASELKRINPHTIIFIITSHNKYLDDAMDLQVFRYIQKPINIGRMFAGLDKALERLKNTSVQFYLSEKPSYVRVCSDDIIYIEIVNRKTNVVTFDNTYVSALSIKEWMEKLPKGSFYPVHTSFIVNLKHITAYSRESVVMDNRFTIPISNKNKTEFRTFFLHFNRK
ncbi:MAG: response regulator transcription factor [Clostridia bacterium]|nr:response regulator transcription factor [Clostridia bacterium]